MASAAAELFVKVTADIKGLASGFGAAVGAAKQLGEGIDEAAGHWVDANGRMRDASGKFVSGAKAAGAAATSIGDIMKGVAGGELLADGLRGAADAMLDLGKRSLSLAGELEQNKVAFTTMLKSGEAADKMLRDLATFAASTPFELRGLTDSAKKLIAFGFSSQSIIPIMTSLGDAIGGIGGGQEAIGQVTMALGQMAAKGKVSAEEMNQFAEKGINTWKYVAAAIGKSVPEAMKLAEKGAIDAATAIPAILQGMSKEFGGMMEKQSKTWNGALSNFQDATDQAMTKIGDAIIRMGLGEMIQKMTAGVNNLAAAFESGRIIPAIQLTEAAVIGLAVAMASRLLPAAVASGAAMVASFVAAAAAAAPFIALAAAVAFAAYPIVKNWQEIKWGLQDVFDAGMKYMTAFYNFGSGIVRDFANNWITGMNYIAGVIRSVLGNDIADKLIGGVKAAGAAFTGFAAKASPALKAVGDFGRGIAGNFRETWSDAMASAKLVTVDLFKTTAAGKVDVAKITAELLGLKKGQMAASDAAKKHHETAEQAAKRHAREVKALEAQYQRNLKTYIAQEDVTYKLRDALKKVADDQERLGLAFDVAGATAEAYRGILGKLEEAYGKTSRQVMIAKKAIAEFEEASKNGGAASAAAYKAIAEGAAELEKARAKAQALGLEFKATDEAIKTTEDTIRKLIDLGLKPGEKAYDEQIAKLGELRKAQEKVPPTIEQNIAAMQRLGQGTEGVGRSADKLISGFGIAIPSIITDMVGGFFEGSMAVLGLASAFNEANQAMQDMDRKAKESGTDGLLATLKAIALIVGIAKAGYDMYTKSVERHNEEQRKAIEESDKLAMSFANIPPHIQQMNFELEQSTIRAKEAFATIKDAAAGGLKDATLAFLAGAQNYGDIIREKVREGIFNAVVDAIMKKAMLQKFDELIAKIVQSFEGGVGVGTKVMVDELINSLKTTSKQSAEVIKQVLEGLGFVPAEIQRRADAAMGMLDEMNKRNAEAMSSYGANIQQSLNRTLERTLNRGSQTAEEANLIGRLLSEQEMVRRRGYETGMATGGLVTGPVIAKMGEGGRDEAVLPLNDRVFSSIAQGIASAGASGTQVVINYTGNGKWTREDAQGLGRLLVSELRAMGVR